MVNIFELTLLNELFSSIKRVKGTYGISETIRLANGEGNNSSCDLCFE